PELRYAQLGEAVPSLAGSAGTAATADPVSCEAGAITGTGPAPVSAITVGRRGPSRLPGGTMVPSMRAGRSKAFIRPKAQFLLEGSSIWLVLASVNSFTLIPVKR